jgi:DNA-binding HxlR family transcriptional regulator
MTKVDRQRRSDCPISISLEIFGDRWTLLIVRDLMLKGRTTFREFLDGGEGIASNVLADRLSRLETHGIVGRQPHEQDRRRHTYRLTQKGIELAPLLLEIILWAARHEATAAPADELAAMTDQRASYLADIRGRWETSRGESI